MVVEIDKKTWVYDTGSPLSFGKYDLILGQRKHHLPRSIPGSSGQAIDSAKLSLMLACEIAGLIGNDTINQYDHMINLPTGELEIHSPGSLRPAGKILPVKFEQGCPTISCTMAKEGFRAVFDTGAPHCHLSAELAGNLPILGTCRDTHPEIGEFEVDVVQPTPPITASGARIAARWMIMHPAIERRLSPIGWHGIVGTDFLRERRVCHLPSRGMISAGPDNKDRLQLALIAGMATLSLGLSTLLMALPGGLGRMTTGDIMVGLYLLALASGLAYSVATGNRYKERPTLYTPPGQTEPSSDTEPADKPSSASANSQGEIKALSELVAKVTAERDALAGEAAEVRKSLQQVAQLWALLDFNRSMRADGKMTEGKALEETEFEVQGLLEYLDLHPYVIPLGAPFRGLPDGSYVIVEKTAASSPSDIGTVKRVRARAVIRTSSNGEPIFIIPAKIDIYT